MNEELSREILAELRKQTQKLTQYNWIGLTCIAALGVVLGFYFYFYARQRMYPRSQDQDRPPSWSQVEQAMDRVDHQKALSLAKALVERAPHYYYGYSFLGSIYLAMGETKQAESQYGRAYELFPSEDNEKNLQAIRKRSEQPVPEPRRTQ
jgi:cytochrome c-type biogenesis protein CcmH/NrfG